MTDSNNVIYVPCTDIQEGKQIWSKGKSAGGAHGETVTISKLPSFLKGTSLFKLPMADVEKETVFTITALPSSTIYIVQQKEGGWADDTLLHSDQNWARKNCTEDPFEVKKPVRLPGVLPKDFNIFYLEKRSTGTTTVLPKVTSAHKLFAIFLAEGKM